jgi:hypothetical protein
LVDKEAVVGKPIMPFALKPMVVTLTGSLSVITTTLLLKVAVAFHTPVRLVIPVVARVNIAGLVFQPKSRLGYPR